MQTDPMAELARLREYYHPMSDDELLELEGAIKDLNPTAQQVLNDELSQRGIGTNTVRESEQVFRGSSAELMSDFNDDVLDDLQKPVTPAVYDDSKQFVDNKGQAFTYKTLLCECDKAEQAMQMKELLRRNGIESWIVWPTKIDGYVPSPTLVSVGADQLEQAKMIAAQPMPQEIVKMFEEIQEDVGEYEPPKCPQCGDEDPVLENAEPVNQWLCESCGHTWEDEVPE